MKRLFGTDGIRGVAGEPPLDDPGVRRFGAALAEVLARAGGHEACVVLGRDTRESGERLRDCVASGLASRGATSVDAGVITTPGLAYWARHGEFDAGVMISASHNPFRDNGLKVFSRDGVKLPDEREREIEALILDSGMDDPGEIGRGDGEDTSLSSRYADYLIESLDGRNLAGLRLLMDCANGAAYRLGPDVYRRLAAEVETVGTEPDGCNINLGCGSLHVADLADRVREGGYDLGLAFDGDADRALAVDSRGRVVDGDHILYLAARRLQREGRLRGGKVVATVMSNFWLERRLADEGMKLLRAPVGDKYVLERMVAEDAALGGEQSGHVIFRDLSTTGDGMLTGLVLLEALQEERESLEEILDGIEPCPQLLLNVEVRKKPELASHGVIGPAIARSERELDGAGRIVVRYSGTEPLARVMVEGDDERSVRGHAESLADLIRKELGES
jgi:phosphoglucosamine mutase